MTFRIFADGELLLETTSVQDVIELLERKTQSQSSWRYEIQENGMGIVLNERAFTYRR